TLKQKIMDGTLAGVSLDEPFEGTSCVGAPVDYTRPYRFTGWVKTENAADQAYLQIVWIAAPRLKLADKPLIPESPKLRAKETYFSILGVSESIKAGGSQGWRKLTVDAQPPYGASHAQFVVRTDGNQGKIYVDDLDFDGFGSRPVEVVLPQIGYHPNGDKLALVKTRSPLDHGAFALLDATGKTVCAGTLKPAGADAWGICLSRADFSNCRAQGRYTLKVTGKGLAETTTPAFAISSTLYRDLGMLSINGYFHSARCGTEIPGWHAACHLDMAAIRNDYGCGQQPGYLDKSKPKGAILKHVDLTGGWHDAGSLDKYGELMAPAAIAMCRFWEDTHHATSELHEKYPDVLSEASWGMDYIMRSIDRENHKVYDAPIEWNPNTKDYICLGSDPTDNITGTADDPVCREALDLTKEAVNPKAIRPVALTRLANCLREYDPPKAKELLETAALWNADGNFALALARYLTHGGNPEESAQIEAMAEKIIASYRSEKYPSVFAGYATDGDFPLLFDYVGACPDAKIGSEFKSLVRRISDEILKPLAQGNPYGVVDHLAEPVMTRAFTPSPDQSSVAAICPEKYLQTAYFLVRAGCLLKDADLIGLGERHLQYMLGRNPQGLSMVGGAGYHVTNISTLLYPYGSRWIANKGQIPGSVGTMATVSDGSRNWIYSLAPLDFPIPQVASELTNTYLGSGEVYEVPTGWLIAVCGALDRALKTNQ
ncbi:MAG: glycoside hydrolase family 9 protein, partial [Verrucomicrobiota bacterium]